MRLPTRVEEKRKVTLHDNEKIEIRHIQPLFMMGATRQFITTNIEFKCSNLKNLFMEYNNYSASKHTRTLFSLVNDNKTILQVGIPRPSKNHYEDFYLPSLMLHRETTEQQVSYLAEKKILQKIGNFYIQSSKSSINFESFLKRQERLTDRGISKESTVYFCGDEVIPRVFRRSYSFSHVTEMVFQSTTLSLSGRKMLKSLKYLHCLKKYKATLKLTDQDLSPAFLKGYIIGNSDIFLLFGLHSNNRLAFDIDLMLTNDETTLVLNRYRKLKVEQRQILDLYVEFWINTRKVSDLI